METAKILIQFDADLTSSGEKGQTSLHKACAVGNIELVKVITDAARKTLGKKGLAAVSIVIHSLDPLFFSAVVLNVYSMFRN